MTFTPDDDACQSAGEGITRASEPGAIHWPCEITFASSITILSRMSTSWL
jgi:hypothetical protein